MSEAQRCAGIVCHWWDESYLRPTNVIGRVINGQLRSRLKPTVIAALNKAITVDLRQKTSQLVLWYGNIVEEKHSKHYLEYNFLVSGQPLIYWWLRGGGCEAVAARWWGARRWGARSLVMLGIMSDVATTDGQECGRYCESWCVWMM